MLRAGALSLPGATTTTTASKVVERGGGILLLLLGRGLKPGEDEGKGEGGRNQEATLEEGVCTQEGGGGDGSNTQGRRRRRREPMTHKIGEAEVMLEMTVVVVVVDAAGRDENEISVAPSTR